MLCQSRRKLMKQTSDRCWLCGRKWPISSADVNACSKANKIRHNKVWSHLHWSLILKYRFQVHYKWCRLKSEDVIESNNVKILWDFNIQVDRIIQARRRDLFVINRQTNECQIIHVAMFADHNVQMKSICLSLMTW